MFVSIIRTNEPLQPCRARSYPALNQDLAHSRGSVRAGTSTYDRDGDEMNILDAGIMVVIAALVMVGFFSGVGRVITALAALYFSTLVSAAFYDDVARRVRDSIEGVRVSSAELASFLFLFALFTVAFYWVISYSFKTVSARRGRFVILDNIGGAALAVAAGMLTVAMTLSVTVIIIGALSQTSALPGGRDSSGFLEQQIQESELSPIVLKLQPPITVAFKPWFSDELPVILQRPPT